jgi:hypothetical protein
MSSAQTTRTIALPLGKMLTTSARGLIFPSSRSSTLLE